MKLTIRHPRLLCRESLPPWERGLKCTFYINTVLPVPVAPPVGAWIEIFVLDTDRLPVAVAPPVGAWIEIGSGRASCLRGAVAPPVGAWIEMVQGFFSGFL